MSEITGIVENIDGNNLYLKGHERPYFALESSRFHLKEYQPGDGARIVLPKKGEFSAIFPWTPPEGWTSPSTQKPPQETPAAGAPAAPGGQAGVATQGGPGKAEPGPSREAPGKVQMTFEGVIESVSIKATINLGNYNDVALEVSANSGNAARAAFMREIQPTIDMARGIIQQVDQGGRR